MIIKFYNFKCSLLFHTFQITGIGLRAVFTLISQAKFTDSHFCEHALRALLDVLQGHPPEELAQEPPEVFFIFVDGLPNTSIFTFCVDLICCTYLDSFRSEIFVLIWELIFYSTPQLF